MSAVSEIMSSEKTVTITADPGNTARDVAEIMAKKKIGSVIVIDKKMEPVLLLKEIWSDAFVWKT